MDNLGLYGTVDWLVKKYKQLCCLIENIPAGPPGPQGPPGPAGSIADAYYGSFIFNFITTLTAAISNPSSTAAIQVTDTTGFNAPGYMKIGNEIVGYTGTTATTFTGITRGVGTSSASSHPIGSGVSQAQWTPADTPVQVLLDETDLSNGVTLSGVGDITIANAGVYNIQFSIQFLNSGNDVDDVAAWFRANGIDIPKSATHATVAQSHAVGPGALVMTVNLFYIAAAGDVMSLMWTNDKGTTVLSSIYPIEGIPQSPAVILTVNRIG